MYSRSALLQLSLISSQLPSPNLWQHVNEHGISRMKPTGQGCRGGQKKHLNSPSGSETVSQHNAASTSNLEGNYPMLSDENFTQEQEPPNLHDCLSNLLNIQANTSKAGKTNSHSILLVPPHSTVNPFRTCSGLHQCCRNISNLGTKYRT